jgi:hypothetical protein
MITSFSSVEYLIDLFFFKIIGYFSHMIQKIGFVS